MNISCPDCYAVYEVDLPDLEDNGEIDVKCVKCQCVFTVHGEPAFSNIEEGGASDEQPSFGTHIPTEESEASPSGDTSQDDELDDFLDNLIEREITDAANEPYQENEQEDSWPDNPDDLADHNTAQESQPTPDEYSSTNDFDEIEPKSVDEEIALEKAFEDDTTPETNEDESDDVEDLWSKAFSEEELSASEPIKEETSSEDDQNIYSGIDLESNREEKAGSDPYGLEYDDGEESFDDFELNPKKKSGFFSLPGGKTRSLVLAGIFVGILLIGGSAYFAFQTFAPDGLADLKKPDSKIPEGLTPKNNPDENIFSTEDVGTEKPAPSKEKLESAPAKGVKSGLAAELANSKVLEKSEGVSQPDNERRPDKNAFASLNPSDTQVTMSAILPVAYDANDIKILSFTLELDLSNQNAAQRMRESLPVYESILVAGVEGLTSNQFFNDIIYVKEKLKKRFVADFNDSLQVGRVSKARFREFLIQ